MTFPAQQPVDLDSPRIIVRETVCKTILNRTSLGDYSLNCYTGCDHACVYCYARFMQRFHAHEEPWGQFVDVKVNAVEVLRRQLRRARPGEVFVSSACDGWQAIEGEWGLTGRCCELLLDYGFEVHVLTKSGLVSRDLERFAGRNVRIGESVTTLDESLRVLWEPRAASVENRFRVLEQARRLSLKTAIMFGPLLPGISDDQDSLHAMLQRAAEARIDVVWMDALNPRPRVWPAVSQLLHDRFPDLLPAYRRMLFDPAARAEYLAQLGQRIQRAAERASLQDRVFRCF